MLTYLQLQIEASSAVAQLANAHESPGANHLHTVEAAAVGEQDEGASACCIGCFQLMPPLLESLLEGSDARLDSAEPELLCASCILRLAGKADASSTVQSSGGGSGALSPLPKLSLLVKAEAKCQDQMQLLLSQQEILKRQRERLQAAKRAKEESLAAQRELARQRRRHFLMIQGRRKREEELKFLQLQGEENTSRSEQEGNMGKSKKKPKPPKVYQPLQRRISEPSAELYEVSLPHLTTQLSKPDQPLQPHSTNNNDKICSAETHPTTSFSERRRQMMACYSQDLSPLIYGRKPRRLPFPKPVPAIVPSGMIMRRQSTDNDSQLTAVAAIQRNKSQQNGKVPAQKDMKLRPLGDKMPNVKTSNQFEHSHWRGSHEAFNKLSVQLSHRLDDHPSPLTAEIKPVSWASELFPQDGSTDEVDKSVFSVPLHRVAENPNDDQQFKLFPLERQLPNPTFPSLEIKPQVDVTTAPQWEYSAERLSGLLEKYNVSVGRHDCNKCTKASTVSKGADKRA
ncbi:hypothetical protein PInf_017866 [Phytophthora infestans]|nr:hypothetical protein PInf_017866 [Phytophthora infestans]